MGKIYGVILLGMSFAVLFSSIYVIHRNKNRSTEPNCQREIEIRDSIIHEREQECIRWERRWRSELF